MIFNQIVQCVRVGDSSAIVISHEVCSACALQAAGSTALLHAKKNMHSPQVPRCHKLRTTCCHRNNQDLEGQTWWRKRVEIADDSNRPTRLLIVSPMHDTVPSFLPHLPDDGKGHRRPHRIPRILHAMLVVTSSLLQQLQHTTGARCQPGCSHLWRHVTCVW